MAAGKESVLFKNPVMSKLPPEKCWSIVSSSASLSLDLEAVSLEVREKWIKSTPRTDGQIREEGGGETRASGSGGWVTWEERQYDQVPAVAHPVIMRTLSPAPSSSHRSSLQMSI